MSNAPLRHTDESSTAQSTEAGSGRRVHVFPVLFVSGLTAIVIMLCVYSVLSIFAPASLGTLANVLEPPANPKPAWYFLYLYQYFRRAPGFVGALAPAVLLLILALWPYLDRNPSRAPRQRVLALALGGLVLVAIVVLTYLGWRAP